MKHGAAAHDLAGAYVLDAVSDRERADFERHLQRCEQCREDVRGLREAAARLGTAAAIQPRPQTQEQTVRAAAKLRQLPPALSGEQPRRAAWKPVSPRLAPRSWIARAALAVVVVLALSAVWLGVHLSSMQSRLTLAEQRDHAIAAVLGASDAVRLTAKVSTGGMAAVVMSHHADALVIVTHGLAALPSSKGYELWLMGPEGDRPAGMLPRPRGGMTDPTVVRHIAPGDRLGLTIEPEPGTGRPTSALIVLILLVH